MKVVKEETRCLMNNVEIDCVVYKLKSGISLATFTLATFTYENGVSRLWNRNEFFISTKEYLAGLGTEEFADAKMALMNL